MKSLWGPDVGIADYSGLGPASSPWTSIGAEGAKSAALLDDVKYQRALDAENNKSSFSDSIASLRNLLNPEEEEADPFEAYLASLDADAATLNNEESAAALADFEAAQRLAPLTGPSGVDVDTGKFSGSPRADETQFSWGDAINPAFYGFGGKEGFSFENPLGGFGLDEANIFSGAGNLIKGGIKGGSNWFVGNPDTWGGKDSFEDYVKNNKWDAAKTGAKNLMYMNPYTLPIAIAMDTSETIPTASEAVDDPRYGPAMDENTFFQSEDFLHEGDQLGSIDRQREINMLDQDMDIDVEDYPYWYREDDHHGSIAGRYVDERGYATGGRVGLQTGGIPWTQFMSPTYANQYYSQFNNPTLSSLPGITGDDTTGTTTTDPGNILGSTPEEVLNTPPPILGSAQPLQFGNNAGGHSGAGPTDGGTTTDSFGHTVGVNQMGYGIDAQGNMIASHVPSNVTSINVGDPAPAMLQSAYDFSQMVPSLWGAIMGYNQPSATDPTLGSLSPTGIHPPSMTTAQENAIAGNVQPGNATQTNYTSSHPNLSMAQNYSTSHPNLAMAQNYSTSHPNPAMAAQPMPANLGLQAHYANQNVTSNHPNPAMAAQPMPANLGLHSYNAEDAMPANLGLQAHYANQNVTSNHPNPAMAAQSMPANLGLQAHHASQNVTSNHPNAAMAAAGMPANLGDTGFSAAQAAAAAAPSNLGLGAYNANNPANTNVTSHHANQAMAASQAPSNVTSHHANAAMAANAPTAQSIAANNKAVAQRTANTSAQSRGFKGAVSSKHGPVRSKTGVVGYGKGKGSCFIAGTKVSMADGTDKNIEDIVVEDMVKGQNGDNKVIALDPTLLDERKLYSFNDNEHYFFTSEHPFMTEEGWKSIKPEKTKERDGVELYNQLEGELKVGDKLVTETGSVEITDIKSKEINDPGMPLYNFHVSNDNSYIADKYVVHNKGCFIAGTDVVLKDGTTKNIEEVEIGEELKGETSINKVVERITPKLEGGTLYSINDSEAFVTPGHPFKTREGWRSIDPEATKEEGLDLEVSKLDIGDILTTKDGEKKVEAIEKHEANTEDTVYNLHLDGDNTYYADDYLVHNKSCFVKGTPIEMLDGSTKAIETVEVGDKTKGGLVGMTMVGLPEVIYNYKGVEVSGSHFVKEDNRWVEVENSRHGVRTDKVEKVYTMNTSDNRIFIKGIEFTDYNGVSPNDPLDHKFYDDVMDKLNSECSNLKQT
jgi:hypothetical protein